MHGPSSKTRSWEDPDNGVYHVRRSVFADEELFEMELQHFFESNWVYLT
ncbi:hypothetical protein [Streptomyces tauricus]